MITLRRSEERGQANHGWLKSAHTFSFAGYYDPAHMGFGPLRVINDDVIAAGRGFGTHGHRNMEIITFVLEGALEHKDSMGNGSAIRPGEIQVMSAGSGVTHSEFNHSKKEVVHLLQIWITPNKTGLKPTYQQKSFSEEQRLGKLCLLASGRKQSGAATINQDADLFTAALAPKGKVEHALKPDRHAWVQVTRGSLTVNNTSLNEGDAAAISDEKQLELSTATGGEFLLFDLA